MLILLFLEILLSHFPDYRTGLMNSRNIATLVLLLSAAALFSPESRAEGGCPDGFFPIGGGNGGWHGCAPMGNGSGEPAEEWETRWGAIATGNGLFGAAEGASSKSQAEKIALRKCKESGNSGGKCKIKGSYHDQCAALAWGDAGAIAFRSPDKADAEANAVAACSQQTTNCQLYYSACSYPVRLN